MKVHVAMFFLMSSRKHGARTSDELAERMEKALLENKASELRQTFKEMEGNEDACALKVSCLGRMISEPNMFFDPIPLIDVITERHFSFRDFFHYTAPANSLLETSLWGMYEKTYQLETAKAAAIFLAEYFSYRILKEGEDFKTSYQEYIKGECGEGLSAVSGMIHRKASVIATQNALIDYMKTVPDRTPLQDARLMLPLVRELTKPDILCLYEKKLLDITIRAKKGTQGMRVTLSPVYNVG